MLRDSEEQFGTESRRQRRRRERLQSRKPRGFKSDRQRGQSAHQAEQMIDRILARQSGPIDGFVTLTC